MDEFMKLNQELISVKGKVYEKQEVIDRITRDNAVLNKKLSSAENSLEATNNQLNLLKDEVRQSDLRVKVR